MLSTLVQCIYAHVIRSSFSYYAQHQETDEDVKALH